MLKSLAAAALGVLCVAAPVAAQSSISFDPFPGVPTGVSVKYFQNTGGVLGALPTTLAVELYEDLSAVENGGAALLLADNSEWLAPAFEYGALFSFDDYISAFSAIGNDFSDVFGTDQETVFLTAFDAMGNVLATSTTLSVADEPNLAIASIAAPGIRHVAFSYAGDQGFYTVDNVSWERTTTPVPEPGTSTLLGAGLLALVVVRRRTRTR
ncbi:PEP-CTERM sorting domain-containing protein [Gemmatimonas sp.]